jgi:homoserine kinase type II
LALMLFGLHGGTYHPVMANDEDPRPRPWPALVAEVLALTGFTGAAPRAEFPRLLPDDRIRRPACDLGGRNTANLRLELDRVGSVVARIHPRKKATDRLRAEQFVRSKLADCGLPCLPPLPVFAGDTVGRLDSGELIEVEPYVQADGWMTTDNRMIAGFRLLGHMHQHLRGLDLPAAARHVEYANYLPVEDIGHAVEHGAGRLRRLGRPELAAYADAGQAHLAEVAELERLRRVEHCRQIVHGDFWDNNVLFRGGDIVAVLDFGFMAERTRVDDLALPLWFQLLKSGRTRPDAEDRRLVNALLDAYDSGTDAPLSFNERLSIPLAIARQPAWSLGGWVRILDEATAIDHARSAAAELPIAVAVLEDLSVWNQDVAGTARAEH